MVRQLQPWFANVGKRQVKAPKIYFRDTGPLHRCSAFARSQSCSRPSLGASWEGFALEAVIRELGLQSSEGFFWGTHASAELDLFAHVWGKPFGFELEHTDSPRITPSMRIALQDLGLKHLFVIIPGNHRRGSGSARAKAAAAGGPRVKFQRVPADEERGGRGDNRCPRNGSPSSIVLPSAT